MVEKRFGPRRVAGESRGRNFREVGVIVRGDSVTLKKRVRHHHDDVVQHLRAFHQDEAVALVGRQPVREVDEIGIDEVGALVNDYLVVPSAYLLWWRLGR